MPVSRADGLKAPFFSDLATLDAKSSILQLAFWYKIVIKNDVFRLSYRSTGWDKAEKLMPSHFQNP